MNNFYAPLRALEQKFITYTAELGPGPGKPVLVLCPSARVAAHLQKQLCQEKGVVSNIYFKTFSQLLEELDQENVQQTDPLLPGNRLHEFLLKTLLSRPGLNLYRQSPGFLTALRTSLRDMADSLADPEILKEYVQNCQEPFLLQEQQHLLWLISVYQQYLNQMNKVKGFRSYQVFFNQALAQAEHSAYLQSFHQIVVYGFYELTGRQLELFNALRAHYPVSVFWAYDSHAAFAFGKKFFDTNVLGSSSAQKVTGVNVPIAAQEAVDCLFTAEQAQTRPSQMHLFSAADIEGELFYVAKEILRLHEQEGIAFEDIAITARSLEGYKTLLPEVMRQNFIALNTSFSFGLLSQPLGVMIYNLLSLVRTGFERSSLLAVVTSPYFKHKKQWRYLIEQCLAQRDFAQWKDLLRPTLKNYDSDFMAWLQECRACLEFLEHSHKWATLQETLLTFLEENVDTSVFTAQEKTLWEQVKHIIHNFSRYEFIEEYAGEKEFLDEFFASFLQEQTHQVYDEPNGVSVADVMNLRGLHFKVLFVLGMNEKVFPQIIREDPVLKDYFRRIMRDQLGYWINQKMERFDEERLLFYTTLQAAEKEIYVSFLRSDAEGKPLVPSMYLVELARAARMNLQSEDVLRISAHLPQRLKQVDSRLLTQQEMSLLIALQPRPQEPYTRAGLLDDAKQKSISAAKALSVLGAMGPYDGVVQSGEEIFTLCNEKK
ncbi:MAG: exodeoxyribonuclease V subunit gamma, partial [Elusimicrobiaceae bacterium]|nr:exodeoxyribonuclease V subunit gamma [Elusimicrobiaceae bacterium]